MLTYDEALALARSKKSKINCGSEYNNAYVFSYDSGERTVGGDSPIVIMKDTGEALNFMTYAVRSGNKFIKDFDVNE